MDLREVGRQGWGAALHRWLPEPQSPSDKSRGEALLRRCGHQHDERRRQQDPRGEQGRLGEAGQAVPRTLVPSLLHHCLRPGGRPRGRCRARLMLGPRHSRAKDEDSALRGQAGDLRGSDRAVRLQAPRERRVPQAGHARLQDRARGGPQDRIRRRGRGLRRRHGGIRIFSGLGGHDLRDH